MVLLHCLYRQRCLCFDTLQPYHRTDFDFFNANGGILKFEVDCPELASLGSICENKAEHDLEVVVRVRSLELRECVDGVQSIRLVLMWRQV